MEGALDTDVFHNIVCLANAGGVDEAEGDTINDGCVSDNVTCSAMHIAHYSLFLMKETVEKCTLANVGRSDDGYRYSLLDGIAGLEGVGEGSDAALNLFG